MDGKVLLYDSNDIKIGETFIRRARQLVRQQRAIWIDDSQKALRFVPGMEYMETVTAENVERGVTSHVPNVNPVDEDWLINQTEKRLFERKKFVIHSFTLIPGLVFIFIISALITSRGFYLYEVWEDGMGALSLLSLSTIWVTAYGIHAYLYATSKHATKNIRRKLAKKYSMLENE